MRVVVQLENVIRPFQSEQAFQLALAVEQAVLVPPSTIEWGAAGSSVYDTVNDFVSFTTAPSNYKELFRVTEPQRVENPDDPAQYVIVDKIKQIMFKKTDSTDHKFELKN